jgi:hypothetical protein
MKDKVKQWLSLAEKWSRQTGVPVASILATSLAELEPNIQTATLSQLSSYQGAGNYSYPYGNFTYNGAKYYYSGSGFQIEGVFEDTSGLKRFTVEGANDLAASAQVLLNNYFSYFDEWGKG